MIDRRVFLGTLGAACAAGLRLDAAKMNQIGMQLYTVRNELEKDFDGTLAKVAAIGYKEVEFAGYFKRTPQQVRAALDKTGLSSPAAHVEYALLTDKFDGVLETAKVIGHRSRQSVDRRDVAQVARGLEAHRRHVQPGGGAQQEGRDPVRV